MSSCLQNPPPSPVPSQQSRSRPPSRQDVMKGREGRENSRQLGLVQQIRARGSLKVTGCNGHVTKARHIRRRTTSSDKGGRGKNAKLYSRGLFYYLSYFELITTTSTLSMLAPGVAMESGKSPRPKGNGGSAGNSQNNNSANSRTCRNRLLTCMSYLAVQLRPPASRTQMP